MNACGPIVRARQSEIVPLADYLADPDSDWDAIAQRASEPNSFFESWFLGSAGRHLSPPADTQMLVVRDQGQTIGLFPIRRARGYARLPVAHITPWHHFNSFFGAPLVRRGFEEYFWYRALALLDADPLSANLLHLPMMDGNGPLTSALLRVRAGAAIVHRSSRALLASDLSPQAYYETTVRKKKRKEIGRQQSRLHELGTVTARHLSATDNIDTWIDDFLALESSGWKGRDGAALANDRGTTAFTRAALRGAHARQRLQIVRLDLDTRPLAMLVNFVAAPGAFSFKIAFDEEFARFSPGVLVQLENLAVLNDPTTAWMDSCAVEDHPMINSLWGERRQLVRVTVPLKGWRRRAVFTTCRTLERGSALLRGRS